MNSLYGRYRTVTFSNIWSDEATFRSELMNSKLYNSNFTQSSITKLYYLLYAEYGNSHIASSDANQFKYKLYAIVFSICFNKFQKLFLTVVQPERPLLYGMEDFSNDDE